MQGTKQSSCPHEPEILVEGKGDHWERKPGEGTCSTNRYWAPTVSQALDQVVEAHHQSRPGAWARRNHQPGRHCGYPSRGRREAAAAFLWELLLTSLPPALTTWPVSESKCAAPPQRPPLPACSKRHSSEAGVGDLGPAAEPYEAQADRLAWSSAGRGEMIALGTNQ